MKKLLLTIALLVVPLSANAAGKQWGTGASFEYTDAALDGATEYIIATNVAANIAAADVDLSKLSGAYTLHVWLAGGAWPIDVAYNTAGEGLPVEFFVRWRENSGGAWHYDGFLFPGLGTAHYQIPLPPLVDATSEVEVVANNPRTTKTADVSAWGSISEGTKPPVYAAHNLSSVITPAGSAVASRCYATFCFRRPAEASQLRWYAAAVDGTATQSTAVGFYRPSYSEDGAYWGALTSSATSPHRWTIAGDLVCSCSIFVGSFSNAATASFRYSGIVGPYAP